MVVLGIAASFFSREILARFGSAPEGINYLLIKMSGALYLGFAGLNWMGRANLIGGIYSRPVAVGNFFHFTIIAITLLKWLIVQQASVVLITGAGIYTIFAVCFGYILFVGGKACK